MGLSWWLSVKESACQRRGHGFDPWSGNIPEELSLCATTTEACTLEPVLRNTRSHRSEKPGHRS